MNGLYPKLFWISVKTIIVLFLAGLLSYAMYFTYWLWFPSVPLVVYCKEFKVVNQNKTVCRGSDMIYETDFEKKLPALCRVTRQLVNGYVIQYSVSEPPIKPPGRIKERYRLYVPPNAELAVWEMRWTAECDGQNMIDKPVPVVRQSEKFTVIDCDPNKNKGVQGRQGVQGKPGTNFWGR
jgi:hypothetical protein